MLTSGTEASRAKHKFAVKRNSWPRTRGVAMNPVDHVRTLTFQLDEDSADTQSSSLTVVVTTSISVKPRPSPATPYKVKRLVSSLPGELVSYVVPRRSRIRYCIRGFGVWWIWMRFGCHERSLMSRSLAQHAESYFIEWNDSPPPFSLELDHHVIPNWKRCAAYISVC